VATRRAKLVKLQGVPPDAVTMLRLAGGGCPAMAGRGFTAFVCPTCGTVQCKGVAEVTLRHVVFRCDCGTLSRVARPADE
jgi:hypothetical protein